MWDKKFEIIIHFPPTILMSYTRRIKKSVKLEIRWRLHSLLFTIIPIFWHIADLDLGSQKRFYYSRRCGMRPAAPKHKNNPHLWPCAQIRLESAGAASTLIGVTRFHTLPILRVTFRATWTRFLPFTKNKCWRSYYSSFWRVDHIVKLLFSCSRRGRLILLVYQTAHWSPNY